MSHTFPASVRDGRTPHRELQEAETAQWPDSQDSLADNLIFLNRVETATVFAHAAVIPQHVVLPIVQIHGLPQVGRMLLFVHQVGLFDLLIVDVYRPILKQDFDVIRIGAILLNRTGRDRLPGALSRAPCNDPLDIPLVVLHIAVENDDIPRIQWTEAPTKGNPANLVGNLKTRMRSRSSKVGIMESP